jgi:hypothetical protein
LAKLLHIRKKNRETDLTMTGLLMEGDLTIYHTDVMRGLRSFRVPNKTAKGGNVAIVSAQAVSHLASTEAPSDKAFRVSTAII